MSIPGLPTPQDQLDYYYLVRNILWRYRLDEAEEVVIRRLAGLLDEMRREISERILQYGPEKFTGQRLAALLEEIELYSAAVGASASSLIAEASSAALEASVIEQANILSLGGRSPKVRGLGVGGVEFGALMATAPLGGRSLQGWVDGAIGAGQEQVRNAIQAGMFQGEGYRNIVNRVLQESADLTMREAVTLVRTYVQSASAAAQEAVFEHNKDILGGLEWSAVLEPSYKQTGRGTCIRCAALDGTRYRKNEEKPPMPLHPRCLTGETPVFAPDKIAAFVSTYDGPICEIGLSNGARFSVTANHMFLTPNGFIPAYILGKGAKVFYNPMLQRVLAGNPSDNRNPTRIDEVIEAFAKTPGVSSVSMPASPEYLHGDGKFVKGEIDIIAPDSLLRGDMEAFIQEHGAQFPFCFCSKREEALLAEGLLMEFLFALRNAALGSMSGQSVFEVLGGATVKHHEAVCGGVITDRNACFNQSAADATARYPKFFGQGVFRDASKIAGGYFVDRNFPAQLKTLDRQSLPLKNASPFEHLHDSIRMQGKFIRNIARQFPAQVSIADVSFNVVRNSCCQVYDLQTFSTLYHVNGAISSNCRCLWRPVVDWKSLGVPELAIEEATRPYTIRDNLNIDAGGRREILEVGMHKGDWSSWASERDAEFKEQALGPQRYALWRESGLSFESFSARLVDKATGDLLPLKKLEARL